MKIIFDYNRTIFDPEGDELFPGVFELLAELSKNHELFLVSMNEPGREARFGELGIEHFFETIVFVSKKTPELFAAMVKGDKEVVVVGDRIKHEILLGNKLGFTTIWLNRGKFSAELPDNGNEEPDYVINDTRDVKNIISKIEPKK